jgi:uncharacterized Zn-binding protein involved in type VI secretion
MPPVTRTNIDPSTGHGGYVPRPSTPNGSADVFINGQGVVRVTDAWPDHTDPGPPDTHGSAQSGGSSTFFVNGLAVARIGDAIGCGDAVAGGSPDVIAG